MSFIPLQAEHRHCRQELSRHNPERKILDSESPSNARAFFCPDHRLFQAEHGSAARIKIGKYAFFDLAVASDGEAPAEMFLGLAHRVDP